jgi:hypothetical protein
MRRRATELRRIAADLNNEANLLESQLSELPLLGGRALADAAVSVLSANGNDGMHYRELLDRIEAKSGMRVRGVDPAATLLANLDRDERVTSLRSRSGRYALISTALTPAVANAGASAHSEPPAGPRSTAPLPSPSQPR